MTNAPDDDAAAAEIIGYGLRVFAKSPEGFYVEVVADETDRPLDWIAKTTRGLKAQRFEPVNPFPAPAAPAPARGTPDTAPDPRVNRPQGAQAARGSGGRPSGPPQGRQGGQRPQGGPQRGNNRGAPAQAYHGAGYDACPWCRGDVYDNVDKKDAGNWRGPYYGCKDRDNCGWAVWRPDGTYDE